MSGGISISTCKRRAGKILVAAALILGWAALSFAAAALIATTARAQVMTSGGAIVPTLKQQLDTGLLARTPDERAFVDRVVAAVDAGELPVSLVQGTFLWARSKRPYPMPYFERALRLRAARVGIDF